MKVKSTDSKRIARWLKERGLQDVAAFLLDVAGPFRVLAAQTMYIAEPMFGGQESLIHDFACILEDPEEMDVLMDHLIQDGEIDG